jgi:hypothetical protein
MFSQTRFRNMVWFEAQNVNKQTNPSKKLYKQNNRSFLNPDISNKLDANLNMTTADTGRRIASSLYEENFQKPTTATPYADLKEPPLNIVKLHNNLYHSDYVNYRTREEWSDVFETAAFFKGYDMILGEVVVMVYEDPDSHKISTVLFSCLGEFHFNSCALDHTSRFFDACKNLDKRLQKSNVRRALAITLLKVYSSLDPNRVKSALNVEIPFEWDETAAGELASSMKLVSTKKPFELGESLLNLGFLQSHYIESTVLDVVYEDKASVIDLNNKLVFLLGQQLEQLFDPLTEYSPESTDVLYTPPEVSTVIDESQLIQEICKELLQLQENVTTQLVEFLRDVVIPIRMRTLDGEIKGLTTAKLNQVFPPTVDEVTRVNCIFLEALRKASPYGSFEIIKACGSCIPFFYKATMRHESALKSFNGDLKEFLSVYGQYIPSGYSESQIDANMRSQMNLTKIKLILERLVNTKDWTASEKVTVDQNIRSAIDTIDSFGKEDLKPYNKRIFTPSGKILTEICENWPPVLSYGWVNRKVISVIDTTNQNNREKGVIVIFSDYVVFANVVEKDDKLYSSKPQVSDILMNSLINENPISNMPSLRVTSWSSLKNLEISTFDENSVSFYFKDGKSPASVYEIDDTSRFMRIYNKALILSKTTPFHLFKIEKFGFDVFVTAHERLTYSRETNHSPIVLFLNIEMDQNLLADNGVEFGLFAKFIDDELIEISTLSLSGASYSSTINSSELSSYLSQEISSLETKRRTIESHSGFTSSSLGNRSLLSQVIAKPLLQHTATSSSRNSSSRSSNMEILSTGHGRRTSMVGSANLNKELPKIDDRTNARNEKKPLKSTKSSSSKQNKLIQRLSKIFSKRNAPEVNSSRSVKPTKSDITPNISRRVPVPKRVEQKDESHDNSLNDNVPELSGFDDVKTFESSMSAIFDEYLEEGENFEVLADVTDSLTIARDPSFGTGLIKENVEVKVKNSSDGTNKVFESFAPRKPQIRTLFGGDDDGYESQKLTHSREISIAKERLMRPGSFPSFNSRTDGFPSPLLKVGIESQEDLHRDYEIFYTPMSSNIGFQNYVPDAVSSSILGFEFDSFDMDKEVSKDIEDGNVYKNINILSDSQETFSVRTSSFQSCLDNKHLLEDFQNAGAADEVMSKDDSFLYLAKIVDGSFNIQDLRKSETYQTLPRSFSSLKYLASYIDTNFAIDS